MNKVNLYDVDTSGVEMKDCGGNLQSGMETCVAFAPIPGVADAYVLRDTKPEGHGSELRFTGDELRQFVARWSHEGGTTA